MGDQRDFHLKTVVLLLAEFFEKIRNMCLQNYKLDPSHYFSSPELSLNGMLKMTGIRLDLISYI